MKSAPLDLPEVPTAIQRPIHRLSGAPAQWANRMLGKLAVAPLGAVERSLKLLPREMLSGRFLVGIPKASWPHLDLGEIVSELGIPPEMRAQFDRALAKANYLGLAFEDGADRVAFKAYLEFSIPIELHASRGAPPALLYLGLKWNPDREEEVAVTQYLWKPKLRMRDILAQIAPRMNELRRGELRTGVLEILGRAHGRVDARKFTYLEASEPSTTRNSFDLNLYPARLRIGELRDCLTRIGTALELGEDEIQGWINENSNDLLGHLSAGVDRSGRDFLTIYHDEP